MLAIGGQRHFQESLDYLRTVVATFDAAVLQCNPEIGAVVLQFPSGESARGYVNDPEYQPAKELRIAVTTNAYAVLTPELQMSKG